MENKKILFITSSYPFGKGESFIIPEIEEFSKFCKLAVVPTHPRGEKRSDLLQNHNIEHFNLSLLKLNYIQKTILFSIFNPKLLVKLIEHCKSDSLSRSLRNLILIPKSIYIADMVKSFDIQFIYAHWLSAPTQLALLVHLLTSVEYGITGHRWDVIDRNNFDLKFRYAKFIRLISKKSISLLPNNIQKKYMEKIHVIYMGIDIKKLHNASESLLNRDKEIKILCIANLIPVKGHKYLIDAISGLHKKGYKVYLDLIGNGELESEIKNQIQLLKLNKYIKLLGILPHSKVNEKLANGDYDIYCQPSLDLGNGLHEGIPVSLMEAMSYGIPCISTNTGSIPELIDNGKTGLLVRDKDPIALTEAIERFMNNPELIKQVRENAFYKVFKIFNKNANSQKILRYII